MAETCPSCAALERELDDIKGKIADEIRRGHQHRSDTPSEKATRRSLGKLVASLAESQALYDRHRRDCHNPAP